jgi:hypothetical protein
VPFLGIVFGLGELGDVVGGIIDVKIKDYFAFVGHGSSFLILALV